MRTRAVGGEPALQRLTACLRGWTAVILYRRFAAGLLLAGMLAFAGTARAQEATLVMDAKTGEFLYSYKVDKQLHPASLTKMMTLYMAFEALRSGRLKPGQALKVSRFAAGQRPSRLGLKRGKTIKTSQAILALITKSANDAAVVLAEAMSGSERDFARAMTVQARQLGMEDTIFRNASGLHDGAQVTTARDMGKLAMALLRNHPDYYGQFATRNFSWRGRRYTNHNPLLTTYKGADGIKTGYIRQSGYNLVGSAERDGQRVIAVVLGSRTPGIRNWTMTTLMDYGFEQMATMPSVETSGGLPYITNPTGDRALRTAIQIAVAPKATAIRARPGGPTALSRHRKTTALASADSKRWAVQVGAYPSASPAENAALEAKAKIPNLLGSSRTSFPQVTRDGSQFYRARLVGLTENEARAACRQLASHAMPCLAINANGSFSNSHVD